MEIKNLSLDLETKSSVDIGKAGAYKYAESPDFEILLFGVSVNHGPIFCFSVCPSTTAPSPCTILPAEIQSRKRLLPPCPMTG